MVSESFGFSAFDQRIVKGRKDGKNFTEGNGGNEEGRRTEARGG
jgi:hypothetical protein